MAARAMAQRGFFYKPVRANCGLRQVGAPSNRELDKMAGDALMEVRLTVAHAQQPDANTVPNQLLSFLKAV
jgi:hypothetical protein